MSAMDGSIVNVSLDTISKALNTDINGVSWVVIAYLLAISSMIGFAGNLGDAYGRKKVFQWGMIIFSTGSLLCGLSSTLEALILFRVVQAMGAAALMANGLALVVSFIDPAHRGRAIGLNSIVVALSAGIGPVLGGVLTQYSGWESIFFVNVPIGFIGFVLVQIRLPETKRNPDTKLDFVGITLFGLSMLGIVYSITVVFTAVLQGIIIFLVSLVLFILFIWYESKFSNPLISLNLMKDRQVTMGVISAILGFIGTNAMLFLIPFYLQQVLLYSQSITGLILTVFPVSLSLIGLPSGFLAEKIPARKLATIGLGLEFVFLMGFSIYLYVAQVQTQLIVVVLSIGLVAGSLSVFTNSNGTSVMNAAPQNEISIVSGLLNLARNIGFTLGTTISSSLFSFLLIQNQSNLGYVDSYYIALAFTFGTLSILILFGVVLSLLRGHEKIIVYDEL